MTHDLSAVPLPDTGFNVATPATDDADYWAARSRHHDAMATRAIDSATRDIHRRFAIEYRRKAQSIATDKSTI